MIAEISKALVVGEKLPASRPTRGLQTVPET